MQNLQSCFALLYNKAKHEVARFGNIVLAYGASESHDYNLISGSAEVYQSVDAYKRDLEEALSYASNKNSPFLFVQSDVNPVDVEEILAVYKFKKVGKVTCASIDHNSRSYNEESSSIYCVKRVNSQQMLEDWCAIVDEAFGMLPGDTKKVFSPASESLLQDKTAFPLFMLYNNNNEPIATSLLYLPEDKTLSAGHYCWATKTNFRNKGAIDFFNQKNGRLCQGKWL